VRDLSGRVALLTGASRNIGALTARALADQGMRLVLAARGGSEIEVVAADLRQRGCRVLVVPTDVADPASLESLVERARAELGSIDVLVNGAGTIAVAAYDTLDAAQIEAELRVNLAAPMLLTRLVLPEMLARGSGHVVNIASLAGKLGLPYAETYCATKGGLIAFTSALRAAYRSSGVGASVVSPGFVRGAGMYHRMQEETMVRTPFLFGSSPPEKVADAVVRAIRLDLPEVVVNPMPVRPLLALQELFPRLIQGLLPRIGGDTFARAGRVYERRGGAGHR
jgi:short-subunit dehydrogenase